MSEESNSYNQIIKSSAISGGASIANILIGLVRTKVVAIMFGPAGVGLVTMYSSLVATATAAASMGIGMTGARQISQAVGVSDSRAVALSMHAIFVGAVVLACAGVISVWYLRELLAVSLFGDVAYSKSIGWLSLAVAFSVLTAAQGAILQGMRRIVDMAIVSVFGSFANALIGLLLLWRWGENGLVAFVLLGPIVNFVLGAYYVSRLPRKRAFAFGPVELASQWQLLAKIGLPFMAAGVVSALTQLWIRVEIESTLGIEALGQFQSAWMISMHYIGFVLGAMGADYFPRLSSIIHDNVKATELVNHQTEVALLLSGPVLIVMIGFAPLIVELLYSPTFADAAPVLRWQVMGDIFKIAGWPLGFVLLAAGNGKLFFLVETSTYLVMGGTIAGFASLGGLQVTGFAFLLSYAFLLVVVYLLATRSIDFYWSSSVKLILGTLLISCIVIFSLSHISYAGESFSCFLAFFFAIYSVKRLSKLRSM